MSDLKEQLRDSKGWSTLGNAAADRIEELEAQRDELLEALGIIAGNPFLNSDTMQFALAAIAKCEAKP